MEMMALQIRVEAAIIESGLSYGPALSVVAKVPEPGMVELAGVVEEQSIKEKIETLVRTVKGVQSVENRVRLMPGTRYA
jgi:osmotically-inducible protein OsmY